MAQNISLLGASYSDVPAVTLPKTGGGTARFDDASVTTATASDVANGKIFLAANGTITTGTASGGGGGGIGTLISTISLGELVGPSSATDTGKTITFSGANDYDFFVIDISTDTAVNNRHSSTVSVIYSAGSSTTGTKGAVTVGTAKWNSWISSSNTRTRVTTSGYGIYINSATVSSGSITASLYYRSSTNYTGTLNGTYTARVYGFNLLNLIGG